MNILIVIRDAAWSSNQLVIDFRVLTSTGKQVLGVCPLTWADTNAQAKQALTLAAHAALAEVGVTTAMLQGASVRVIGAFA